MTCIEGEVFFHCDALTIYCEAKEKPEDWSVYWSGEHGIVWNCKENEVAENGNIYAIIDGIRYALKDGTATVVYQPSNLKTAKIPANVTYKNNSYKVTSITKNAFYYCNLLTSIDVDSNNEYFTSIDGNLYNKDGSTLLQYAKGKSATDFAFPDGVKNIEMGAFYGCTTLNSITIGKDMTSIGEYAFYNCISLTSVTIPDSVTRIESKAFFLCNKLTNITYKGTKEEWNAINKENGWDYYTGDYTVHCTDGNIKKVKLYD